SVQLCSPFESSTLPAVPIPAVFDGQNGGGLRAPIIRLCSSCWRSRRRRGTCYRANNPQPCPDDGFGPGATSVLDPISACASQSNSPSNTSTLTKTDPVLLKKYGPSKCAGSSTARKSRRSWGQLAPTMTRLAHPG